jgi:C1A family cysteine protease
MIQVITQATEAGSTTMNLVTRKMGRLKAVDLRDHNHLLGAPKRMPSATSKYWGHLPAMDQDDTSECVAFARTQLLTTGPVKNRRKRAEREVNEQFSHEFYAKCQAIDEWKDEPHDGTSVRAAMKVSQAEGWIGEYLWAYEMNPIIAHMLTVGPMQVGTLWTDGMEPDAKGFISATGIVRGGHSYLLDGINTKKRCSDGTVGAFRVLNSWGLNWGSNGLCWISFADFAKLLHEDGEAATAMEILKQP